MRGTVPLLSGSSGKLSIYGSDICYLPFKYLRDFFYLPALMHLAHQDLEWEDHWPASQTLPTAGYLMRKFPSPTQASRSCDVLGFSISQN